MLGKILLIEDEPAQSKALKLLLEYRGFEVECTANWEETCVKLLSFHPVLAIVDLLLIGPHDGFEVIGFLRASRFADIAIMASTSHFVNSRDEILALRAGADDFVRKDADFGLIEARIEALLRRLARSAIVDGGLV
jgi:DNA-binding response OmpR family regulator